MRCQRRPTAPEVSVINSIRNIRDDAMKLALCMVFLLLAVLAEADKECTFGQTKSEECNACLCNPGGQWACTMMKCRAKREATCTPGTEFTEHCNSCTCGRDGMSAYCTTDSCDDK